MGLLKLLSGTGTLRPELIAALEAEGLVVLEQGIRCSIRYANFRSPGRRFKGKVTAEIIGLGISEQRLAIYCRSGRVKLADTRFDEPRKVGFAVRQEDGTVDLELDYDRGQDPKFGGQITIRLHTENAPLVAHEIASRFGLVL